MKTLRAISCLACLLTLGVLANPAFAQDEPSGPNRKGFTLFLSLGAGFQADEVLDDGAFGIGGLNLGLGGFLSPDLALMFRASGTTASYNVLEDFGGELDFTQTSGVGAIALQYWISDRFNIEGGPGFGFWVADLEGTDADDAGFGFLVGAGYSVFQSSKVNLQLGVELAPVFTDGSVVNLGFNLGFQLL
jgi:hypothetical protein